MLLVPGMMFTIEPMINEGSPDFFVDEDNDWTIYTIDDGLSAQIEYMVLVKEDGIEILTKIVKKLRTQDLSCCTQLFYLLHQHMQIFFILDSVIARNLFFHCICNRFLDKLPASSIMDFRFSPLASPAASTEANRSPVPE